MGTLTTELPPRTYAWQQLVSPHVLEDEPMLESILELAAHLLARCALKDGRDPVQPGHEVKAYPAEPDLGQTYTHHLPRTRWQRWLRRPHRTEQRPSNLVLLRWTLRLPGVTHRHEQLDTWPYVLEAVRRNARGTVRTGFARAGLMPTAYLGSLPAGERLHLLETAECGDLERTLAALGLDPVATLGTVELWPFL